MDLRRLRAGELIAALAGTALIVSLFLPWYGGQVCLQGSLGRCSNASGWEALSILDVLLAGAASGAIATLFVTATARTAAGSLVPQSLLTPVGAVLSVATLIRVLSIPAPYHDRHVGAWLGLAGILALTAGLAAAMRDERLSAPGRPTDQTGRPVPAPPEIPAIPPPRPPVEG